MNAVAAISILLDLLNAITRISAQLQAVSGLIKKAQSEGRDLTDAELQQVVDADDAARKALEDAIKGQRN